MKFPVVSSYNIIYFPYYNIQITKIKRVFIAFVQQFHRNKFFYFAKFYQIGYYCNIQLLLLMATTQTKSNTETRGRPRKEQTRTLSTVYKQKFSDNSAILHTSFLIYVFEVFVQTKNEKRVGHKDGGFTIYDKIDNQYCFDNIEDQLKLWQCQALLQNPRMRDFIKLLPALGPKIILKQICELINFIVENEQEDLGQNAIYTILTSKENQQKLDETYPYMRFVPLALHQLKMDKNQKWDKSNNMVDLIRQRVNYLWQYLMKIVVHTVFNCIYGKINNKYFKPFFSDAENPNDTYIGQLNLDQVVMAVKKVESIQRSHKQPEDMQQLVIDKPRKMKSIIDIDGTRTVVQIIKAPQQQNQRRLIENTRFIFESPKREKQVNQKNEQPSFSKGFTAYNKKYEIAQEIKTLNTTRQVLYRGESSMNKLEEGEAKQESGIKKINSLEESNTKKVVESQKQVKQENGQNIDRIQ